MQYFSLNLETISPLAIRSDHAPTGAGSADYISGAALAGSLAAVYRLYYQQDQDTEQFEQSPLPTMLGCESEAHHHIRTHHRQNTCVPGLFVAGDAAGDVQFVIVAAAEGARAAVAINRELQDEDRGESRSPRPKAATARRRA